MFTRGGAEIVGPYRYRLWRHWGDGARPLLWIMLNPSTADAELDDPTIRRCVDFSRRDGFDGLQVCNLFAFRSTDPRQLLAAADPIGPRNDEVIREDAAAAALVVAAWGCVHPKLAARATHVVTLLKTLGKPVHCLGTTVGGHPKHPVRLGRAVPFDVFL